MNSIHDSYYFVKGALINHGDCSLMAEHWIVVPEARIRFPRSPANKSLILLRYKGMSVT